MREHQHDPKCRSQRITRLDVAAFLARCGLVVPRRVAMTGPANGGAVYAGYRRDRRVRMFGWKPPSATHRRARSRLIGVVEPLTADLDLLWGTSLYRIT